MENRKCLRIPFNIKSMVKYRDKSIKGVTLNLSLQGILLNISERIPLDTIVDVEMNLKEDSKEDTKEEKLNVMSRVVRSDNYGTAIRIMKIDVDSFIDLRDTIIDNNGKADKIMNEFHKFILQNRYA